jgi:hypothetical protein
MNEPKVLDTNIASHVPNVVQIEFARQRAHQSIRLIAFF